MNNALAFLPAAGVLLAWAASLTLAVLAIDWVARRVANRPRPVKQTSLENMIVIYGYEGDLRLCGWLPLLYIRCSARLDMWVGGWKHLVTKDLKTAIAEEDRAFLLMLLRFHEPDGDKLTDSHRGAMDFAQFSDHYLRGLYYIAAYAEPLIAARAYRILIAFSAWAIRRGSNRLKGL